MTSIFKGPEYEKLTFVVHILHMSGLVPDWCQYVKSTKNMAKQLQNCSIYLSQPSLRNLFWSQAICGSIVLVKHVIVMKIWPLHPRSTK